MSASDFSLFQRAETLNAQGNIEDAFENHQKFIKKILKDENPTETILDASLLPDNWPREMLGVTWKTFVGFFRDPDMSFTAESHPEAYKLLNAFRPGSGSGSKLHAQLQRTDRGKLLLNVIQISAGLTLGLLALGKGDRATASKRYKEALDLGASTQPPLTVLRPGAIGLEKCAYEELLQARDNLDELIKFDMRHDELMAAIATVGHGGLPQRKEVLKLPLLAITIDKTGRRSVETSFMFATDACGKCGKRDVKLLRCAMCKKLSYCSVKCQKEDWKTHKIASCIKKT